MLRKDFIMRLIEHAARAIAKAIGFKEKGDYQKALDEIDLAYEEVLKMNKDQIQQLKIVDLLNTFEESVIEKAGIMADLLKAEGEIYLEQGNKESGKRNLLKSLELYQYIDEESGVYSIERNEKIMDLNSLLSRLK